MLYLLVKTLLLPPAGNLLLLLLGWLIGFRWKALGFLLCFTAISSLWLMASPKGAGWLMAQLETAPINLAKLEQGQAIVVLGGGRYPTAPEYQGSDLPGLFAQQRLLYAAKLQQQTGLPILTTGGTSDQSAQSEAALMAQFLEHPLNVPTWRVEEHSLTTWENAVYSAQLLQQAQIEKIILVSQAWHLPRAQYAFEQQGLTVYSAGTGYYRPRPWRFSGQYWLPEPEALNASYWAIHEMIGLGWYRFKVYVSTF